MKPIAFLLALAAWLLATPASSDAVPTRIDFDNVGSPGTVLTTQYAAAGLTFAVDGDFRDCQRSALLSMNSEVARSGTRFADASCPGFEGGTTPARSIGGTFSGGQRTVTVMTRILNLGPYTDSQVVTLRARTATGEARSTSATVTNRGWTALTVTEPQNTLTSFEIGYDEPRDQFPLIIDDLSFASDTTPPGIVINQPLEDAVYARGERVAASFSCFDDDSGIATPDGCKGTSANGTPIDTSAIGEHEFVVEARDNAGNTARRTVKYKVVDTRISLSPACDGSGTEGNYTITVSGFGLDPARRGALEFFGGGQDEWQHPQDVIAAADGTFTVVIKPPRRADGFYHVTFHYLMADDTNEGPDRSVGPVIASAVFAVPCPTLEVQPTCGPAAAGFPDFYTLSLVGTGLPPRSNATLAFAGEQLGEVLVDDGGGFTATITPALHPAGIYDITATAQPQGARPPIVTRLPPGVNLDVIAKTVFKVACDASPSITVEPRCGDAGATAIRVRGVHFVAGSEVDLLFDGRQGGRARTAADGTLDAKLTVTEVTDGEHTLLARYHDADPEIPSDRPTASYRVPCEAPLVPSIAVDPTCGSGGSTKIRVTGKDFVADRRVVLLFDGEEAGSGLVAANGTLDAKLSVADARPRLHTISVRYQGSHDATQPTANYVVPCAPQLSTTPDCGQAQLPSGSVAPYKIQVNGRGFVPPGNASVSFNGTLVKSDVAVAEDGTLSAPIAVDALPSGRYEVRVEQEVTVGEGQVKPYVAVTAFTVPCGEVTVTPGCDVPAASPRGGELYRLLVHGKSFAPGSSVALTFEDEGSTAVASHVAKAGNDGRLTTTFKVPREGKGTFLIRATILRGGVPTPSFLASTLVVPCRPPTIKVDPPLGRPGFLTTVTGQDFPANARIRLSWNTGSLGFAQVRSDAQGRFRTRMLVFMHDLLGPRVLNARTETGYSQAGADYLVVPGSQQPSGFLVRR